MTMETTNQLFSMLAVLLNTGVANITIDLTRDEIETWDSLAIINLAIALEGEYRISLKAEEVESLTTVRAVVEILNKHGVRLVN